MDSTTQPQQLSLSFDAPQTICTVVAEVQSHTPDAVETTVNSVAVVYDFKPAVAKREKSSQADLYRQILESVRHIG